MYLKGRNKNYLHKVYIIFNNNKQNHYMIHKMVI